MGKQPLQPSTAHNTTDSAAGAAAGTAAGKKTIEETYQKKTQLEHILLRPDTYIGSIEKHSQTLWVWEDSAMVSRSVSYVPGLYKIFDEILVNAADNKQRDPKMDSVKVEIDPAENRISVYNNGDGVPVEVHQEEGIYVPEMIFGHLLTSSNYDDNEKKTTGGRNGYGAKLTNIFSTEFVIETADGKRLKKYKQVFTNNMGSKSNPSITKCKAGENWTKVTFKPDLTKFNMTELEDDVVALMKKRVVDIAGTLGKTVKVELNGQRVPVKSFADYVNLYLQSGDKNNRFTEKVNDRWEIFVTKSEGQFQQVSFVNGINTIKGGSHVDYVTNQITSHLVEVVNKKKKNANLKAHNAKNHLWVFVNALIDNPAFDSQTKETLTTRKDRFGTKCELSPAFLKKVASSEIVSSIEEWADFKLTKDLKKTDGTKRQKLTGITKLDDANHAGGKDSEKCTLILTEGDSAKALALAGITVVGRDYYGVFPLRGKLLNVREASHKQIVDNAEIQHIKQILGLQQGKVYDSVKGLRYGHLMIMTDQDHDGSHIKGLLINFIHSFWPSLLKVPSFMVEFITPIVKVEHKKNRKNRMAFYSMPEYEAWKESVGESVNRDWKFKYYKGLGTSTATEGKEYFSDLGKHKKDFVWAGEEDNDAIELAFSKKKIEERKNWLRHFEPGTHLDAKDKFIKYRDFVNKELIQFSMADLQRSIPSMVDGLKPGQRKILFCAFKRNLVTEYKVAQFSGYVAEHSAYHHGEQSLASTITGMAQDFVGSNNLNLLAPGGQFGTRHRGGKDHGAARYIFTNLQPLTRFLFHKDDDIILDYLNEDGDSIEPMWYIPIIPMVLVNGSEGIGTGWSSFVPNYNPKDIIANVRRLLNDEPLQTMDPWYRGFKGLIEKSAVKETGATYTITGIIEEVDSTTLRITELPIRKWTLEYKQFLESMITGDDKIKEPFIKDFKENHGITTVHFDIILSEENLIAAKQEGLDKKFKLTTTISTSNMHLFDPKGVIKKYDTPEEILEEFYHLRLQFYEKRKRTLLGNLEVEFLKMDNKVRFILSVVNGELVVNNRKRAELFLELHQKGYTPFPSKAKGNDVATPEESNTDENDKEGSDSEENDSNEMDVSPKTVNEGSRANDYDYLLSMAIGTLTLEKVQELCRDKERLGNEIDVLRNTSIKSLWNKDLDAFEKKLDFEEARRAKKLAKEEEKEMERRMKDRGMKVPKKAPAKPRKNAVNSSAATSTNSSAEPAAIVTDAVAKPKPRGGGQKKAAAAKKVTTVADEEEDEVCPLTERLAAYNLNSSSDSASMETEGVTEEVSKKKETRKRATARKSQSTLTISDDDEEEGSADKMATIVEDVDGDDDFEVEMADAPRGKKGGGGRKPAAKAKAKTATAATAKGRGGGGAQGKRLLSQKLITEVLKPVDAAAASPERKVRRMRVSPFNKKSSSVLSRVAESSPPSSGASGSGVGDSGVGGSGGGSTSSSGNMAAALDEVAAERNRPRRAARPKVTYVESDDSEEVEEVQESEDSDFGEDSV